MSLSVQLADVLRAESYGLDIEETVDGIGVFAMRKDGTLYKLGHVTAAAAYQDPAGAMRAISRIKFATPPGDG